MLPLNKGVDGGIFFNELNQISLLLIENKEKFSIDKALNVFAKLLKMAPSILPSSILKPRSCIRVLEKIEEQLLWVGIGECYPKYKPEYHSNDTLIISELIRSPIQQESVSFIDSVLSSISILKKFFQESLILDANKAHMLIVDAGEKNSIMMVEQLETRLKVQKDQIIINLLLNPEEQDLWEKNIELMRENIRLFQPIIELIRQLEIRRHQIIQIFKESEVTIEEYGEFKENYFIRLLSRRTIVSNCSMMHFAIIHCKYNMIRLLSRLGTDVNSIFLNNMNALLFAISKNYPDLLDCLVASGAKIDDPDSLSPTPLMSAVYGYFDDMIGLLIKNGANPNREDSSGMTPLKLAISDSLFDKTEEFVIKVDKVDPDFKQSSDRIRYMEPIYKVIMCLKSCGADPDYFDSSGWTPLRYAISLNRSPKNEFLIQFHDANSDICDPLGRVELLVRGCGANPNLEDPSGMTPLLQAVMENDLRMIKYLIQLGADPNFICAHSGKTPLSYAISDNNIAITGCLIEYGANPNLCDGCGRTALKCAIFEESYLIMELLIKTFHVDPNFFDPLGFTPVRFAIFENKLRAMHDLIQLGADPFYLDPSTKSPLISAVIEDKSEFIEALVLKYGVNVNYYFSNGETPLIYALKRGLGCIRQLEKLGADNLYADRYLKDQNLTKVWEVSGEAIIQDANKVGHPVKFIDLGVRLSVDLMYKNALAVSNELIIEALRNVYPHRSRDYLMTVIKANKPCVIMHEENNVSVSVVIGLNRLSFFKCGINDNSPVVKIFDLGKIIITDEFLGELTNSNRCEALLSRMFEEGALTEVHRVAFNCRKFNYYTWTAVKSVCWIIFHLYLGEKGQETYLAFNNMYKLKFLEEYMKMPCPDKRILEAIKKELAGKKVFLSTIVPDFISLYRNLLRMGLA